MATIAKVTRAEPRLSSVLLRSALVGLALATAAIHASLGGLLFLMNAVGYTALAIGMIAPGAIGRVRWLVRVGLIGFTAATVGGWVLFGARFPLAYLDKAIEVALIAVATFELWHLDGGPMGVARHARQLAARLAAGLVTRASR
jgi:hypothetical protein